ncbi:MAG: endo-1,4-beta-xylanase [Candidatus Symbiothrix sp.]|jgi:GH35 family endo-1,4-beta-xylanase|nr:endo-1,4-beta-xylanase [Candidatus Symbiothrix sp.]
MKQNKILTVAVLAVLTFGLTACDDDKMNWGKDPSYGDVASSELPLQLQEAISRYEVLNSYTTMTLGVGIDFNLYLNDETYRNIVNQNFDEITPGNEMKQDALMKNDGSLDFTTADALVNAFKTAGLTVYGHTLVWHSQQRASYLNSLIKPTIIPGPAGESLIVGDFEDGLNGFNVPFGDPLSLSTEVAIGNQSMQVTVGDGVAGKYDRQVNSPPFAIIEGHHYGISFFIKSNKPGQVGIDLNGSSSVANPYPWVNVNGTGMELAPTDAAGWTQVTLGTEGFEATANDDAMIFRFLLGAVKDVIYYIDNVEVTDLDAAPAEINLVENGGFESGDLTKWSALNAGAGISVSADAKYSGDYGLKAISSATSSNDWDLQFAADAITLDPTKTYTFSFMIKSDIAGKGRISFPGGMNGNEYPWLDWDGTGTARDFTTSSTWKLISVDVTNTTTLNLQFDLGTVPDVTYFIDDVKVVEKPATPAVEALRAKSALRAATIIEKTPEEKAEIIGAVLNSYVTDVAAHFKGKVAAWDVVNEALNENGTVRTGEEDLSATSTFYWQYYLGKDYAVTAFKAARAADANSAELFINEYNLESSNNKLEGLINYVQYIEGQGASIDGIGTQMHMDIKYTTKDGIDNMFKKLAATGKLIKISEMDIKAGESPTAEDYAAQAELYRYAIESFIKNVPEPQRYGATVWSISDNDKEHEYWLKGDKPCLWDADYARKHAYKGFADGLAGKDVSADFSGDLQY